LETIGFLPTSDNFVGITKLGLLEGTGVPALLDMFVEDSAFESVL
jgi:hypothetical protein